MKTDSQTSLSLGFINTKLTSLVAQLEVALYLLAAIAIELAIIGVEIAK